MFGLHVRSKINISEVLIVEKISEFSIDSIITINENEIMYYDNDKNICRIDLHKCHKNWRKETKAGGFNLFRGKQPKCVGKRELLIKNPYYQFWDLDKTKFIYFGKDPEDEKHQTYRVIENQLIASGWHTMDYC